MKKKNMVKAGLVLFGLAIVMVGVHLVQATKVTAKNLQGAQNGGALNSSPGAGPSVAVPMFLVERKKMSDSVQGLVGTIKGNTIEMTFNGQEERLIAVRVDVGQRVQKGQVLFELDHARAAAKKSQAESGLIRAQELFDAGGATSHDVNDAKATYDLASKDYDDTFIFAPTNGFVSAVNKQVGETVGRSDVMAVLVSSEGRLVLETGVVESQLGAIHEGQRALIEVEAYPGKTIIGKVAGVSGEVTTTGRTGLVLVGIPVPIQSKLRPGLSARCDIVTFESLAFVIPREAYDAEKKSVVVVDKKGTPIETPVTLGHVTRDYYEVVSGLNDGDIVLSDVAANPVEPGTQLVAAGELGHYQPDHDN